MSLLRVSRRLALPGVVVALAIAATGPALTHEGDYYPVGLAILGLPRELPDLTVAEVALVCAPFAVYAVLLVSVEYVLYILGRDSPPTRRNRSRALRLSLAGSVVDDLAHLDESLAEGTAEE